MPSIVIHVSYPFMTLQYVTGNEKYIPIAFMAYTIVIRILISIESLVGVMQSWQTRLVFAVFGSMLYWSVTA